MGPTAWDALNLALCVLFAAGSFYYYVLGGALRGPRDVPLGGSGVPRLLRGGGRVLGEGLPEGIAWARPNKRGLELAPIGE